MTKILNFALKIKGGGREGGTCEVLRPCHPLPPPKKIWNVHLVVNEKNEHASSHRYETRMDDTAKGGLAQFCELFTAIPCAPFKR